MQDIKCIYDDIAKAHDCVLKLCDARELTTFKGGGKAFVFYPNSAQKFAEIYGELLNKNFMPYVIGGGSNTIIADGICTRPFISTKMLKNLRFSDGKIYAESGVAISKVTELCRANGFGGFEFLSGVPATVGGAVKMNASAFSTQTADYICEIGILNADCGKYGVKTHAVCSDDFGYRKGIDGIVLSATIKAENIDRASSVALAKQYLKVRRAKQPNLPSCGSVFKNGDFPSGFLIEECGLKGKKIGGAQISNMHGNFIVNTGDATADDFMELVYLAEDSVYRKFSIVLRREFVYVM